MDNNNPFAKFEKLQTKKIQIKSLGAMVEIKQALSIAEEEMVAKVRYENQGVNKEGRIVTNQASFLSSKILTVSLILVEPKMTTYELGKLVGAEEAIDEIFNAFHEENIKKQEDKGKSNS